MKNQRNSLNKDRVIAGSSVLLFAGALTFAVIYKNSSNDLRSLLDQERQQNSQLVEQSKKLNKDLEGRNARMAAMTTEHSDRMEQLLQEKQRAVEALRKAEMANRSTVRPIDGSKKEIDRLKADLAKLEQALAAANGKMGDLTAENSKLRSSNDKLTGEMAQRKENAAFVNNSMVLSTRGKKEKLVVKARRTQHLNLDIDLPAELATGARMKITGPKGKTFEMADPVITSTTAQGTGEATASVGGGVGTGRRMSRVSMKLCPKEKLAPGTYSIEVYSGSKYLGTTRTTLR